MNGKRVHIWNCKDCLKAWQKLHTPKQVMKHRIWLHASVAHSTRWAWPPADWWDTNTSIQWSTTLCHQVVFACAFGAVSTTRGEACFSTMKTWGNYRIAFSTSPWGYGFQNNISITLFEVHLSWACWPASHMQYIYMFNVVFVLVLNVFMLLQEDICRLGMLECRSLAHGKLKNTYSIFEACKGTVWVLKAPAHASSSRKH